jgi:protein-S-isoprenylcysteine O-methyltransferase Ste14
MDGHNPTSAEFSPCGFHEHNYNWCMKFLSLKIIPPFQVLILGGIMWLIHRHMPLLHYHTGLEFVVSRLILLVCVAIFVSAVYQFWKYRTTVNPQKLERTSALITEGVFAWSRNPIYVVDVLLLLSWAIWLGSWINLLMPIAFIIYCTEFQIKPEEQVLTNKFGDAYIQYRQRVRRWI